MQHHDRVSWMELIPQGSLVSPSKISQPLLGVSTSTCISGRYHYYSIFGKQEFPVLEFKELESSSVLEQVLQKVKLGSCWTFKVTLKSFCPKW